LSLVPDCLGEVVSTSRNVRLCNLGSNHVVDSLIFSSSDIQHQLSSNELLLTATRTILLHHHHHVAVEVEVGHFWPLDWSS